MNNNNYNLYFNYTCKILFMKRYVIYYLYIKKYNY